MLRAMLTSTLLVVFLGAGFANGDDKDAKQNKNDKSTKATITKVDRQKGTITVKMKDANNKEVQKTFKLAEDVRMLDSNGRVAAIDVFEAGNDVLVVEREGKLKEIHQRKKLPSNNK